MNLAVAAYGYGIGVTAAQLISAYSTIANGGTLMEPYIVEKIQRQDGTKLFSASPMQVRRVISEKTAAAARKMLEQVVESGTGMQARIRSYRIAGKTGTAKKLKPDGTYSSNEYVASFCGFAPAENPMFTILVVIDTPKLFHYGGETAAPAFAEITKKILAVKGITPDRPETTAKLSDIKQSKHAAKIYN